MGSEKNIIHQENQKDSTEVKLSMAKKIGYGLGEAGKYVIIYDDKFLFNGILFGCSRTCTGSDINYHVDCTYLAGNL